MYQARNKRTNDAGNSVYDIYRPGKFDHFVATVENASGFIRVLYGALQPRGKELARAAIHTYEFGER